MWDKIETLRKKIFRKYGRPLFKNFWKHVNKLKKKKLEKKFKKTRGTASYSSGTQEHKR